jgi:hypothetical protein
LETLGEPLKQAGAYLLGLLIKMMELDGGFSQMAGFRHNIVVAFETILIGFLAWYLATVFGKKEVALLIKVIVVCECLRILIA